MQEKEQKISPIKQRILQYAEYLGVSKRDFYKAIGVSRGTLESKTGITEDVLAKFIAIYKNVDIEWLLTGRGSMLRKHSDDAAVPAVQAVFPLRSDHSVELQSVPLYEFDATAGLVALFSDKGANRPVNFLQIPDLPPCDGAVYVRGDSMYPLLKSGDIVLYKEIASFAGDILWGEMYLLSFTLDGEDYIAIKYIQRTEDDRFVRLVSYNPHYSPKDIPLDSIHALALIKASVRFNTMG